MDSRYILNDLIENEMTDEDKFSVLMTTYHGENPEFLDTALNSVLINQTRIPDQLVLVVDGPIGDDLDEVIKRYKDMFSEIIDVVYSPINQGQSKASAIGLEYIKYDIFARMDSDDISVSDRFQLQLDILKDRSIDVVGGFISEFVSDPNVSESIREVRENHEEIVKMFPKRMPMNNMTVMMRKKKLIDAGGYGRDTVNEDYSVYAHMWVNGAKFYNIQKILAHVRIGNGMVERRHDFRIYKDWKKDQKYLCENKMYSRFTGFKSNFRCFCFVVSPIWIKKILYKTILRKKGK